MQIKIKNLRLRAIVGILGWERKELQEIIINVSIDFDGEKASRSDNISDTINYKAIVTAVKSSSFKLLESLSKTILDIILSHPMVRSACVEIDKPHALRFADSVSVKCCAEK